MRSFVTIFLKTLLYTLLAVLLVFGAVMVSLQIPAIQTRVVQEVARRVSAKMEFPISIQRVSIKWFNSLTLQGVSIKDRRHQPMIDVGRLEVAFHLRTLLDSSAHNIHLNEVYLYQPNVRLVKNPKTGDLNIDEFIARIDELLRTDTTRSVPDQNIPFTIGKVNVLDGVFTMDDPREKPFNNPKDFDYNHFTLEKINGNVRDFLVLGDTIALDLAGMKAVDRRSGLTVHRLDTRFLYCRTKMELGNLYAHINNSIVRNYLAFLYDSPSAFGNFNARVMMDARLRSSRVQSADLGYFSEYLRGLNETWLLSANFRGIVHDFKLTDTDLRFGINARSRLAGDIAFKGLPNIDRTTVDFAFTPSIVTMADIRQYYPDEGFNHTIQKLGTVQFAATFAGAFDDFRTAGNFQTALGNVSGDLKLKLADNSANTTYTANLKAQSLALGTLVDQPEVLQKLDGEGRITGQGLSLANARVDLDGRFSRFGLNGYDYRNLVVRGNLQKAFFNGEVSVRDENLTTHLDGEFDLRNPRNRFDVQGTVTHADFRALRLLDDSLTVRTDLDVQLNGNTIEELIGEARFRNALVSLNGRTLAVDTLHLSSAILDAGRSIDVTSDFITAHLRGNFQLTQTAQDLQRLLYEYELYFFGDVASRATYYRQKLARTSKMQPANYNIDYVFFFRNIKPVLDFVQPAAYIAPNSTLEGRFTVDNTLFLTANVKSDSLVYNEYTFGPSEVDITTSKFTNSEEVLASAIVTSQRQKLSTLAPTETMEIEASWEQDHIDFTSSIKQINSTNRANVNGEVRFKGDAIDLTFRRSEFRVLDNNWTLNPESLIRKVGEDYTVRNLSIYNQNQLITASGKISSDSTEALRVEASNFLLESLTPIVNTPITGTANGVIAVRNLYKTPIIESKLTVQELAFADFLVGNVRGEGVWDNSEQRLNVDARINRDNYDVLTLRGTYAPQKTKNAFNLKALFNNADLRMLEPFTQGLVSNLTGLATGLVNVTGTPNNPVLDGVVDVRKGRLTFDYLKADFFFEDKIYFTETDIRAKRLLLRDVDGNTAILRGGVYHDGFKYFTLGFDADLKNFKIMNTTARDNELFYGSAVVTGKAELYGTPDNLTIKANVSSNKGTRIYIPLDGAETVSAQDFIRFVSRSSVAKVDTHQTKVNGKPVFSNIPTVDLSGIKMDFNFNITPDAYCEIQLDRQTGDIIKAYGSGRIAMKVDTKGEFSMTGNYEIQQGDYTFTFENVINKRFQIRPNSRITWTGDPYGALLNVTAAYTQYTSLLPLVQSISAPSTSQNTPDRNRRYPVDLLITLTGELLSPSITFDLDVKEYPASAEFRQAVTAFEARLLSNEQELNRQVSSILIFNQLLPDGSGLFEQDNVNAGVANSVSELLSNRFSQLASSLDEKLDVGISLGGLGLNNLNDNLFNNLQLRFSYRFLNDRFRVSRDGGFTYGQNQTNAASLLGEWTLEYWITPDGRVRAKMYNRNQQSVLGQYSLSNTSLTTSGGISLLYTRTFNRLFGGGPRKTKPGLNNPSTSAVPTPEPTSSFTQFRSRTSDNQR
ncbi:translocation/assembly module TamB domain-containing protein [Nibrella saemangeumensis]